MRQRTRHGPVRGCSENSVRQSRDRQGADDDQPCGKNPLAHARGSESRGRRSIFKHAGAPSGMSCGFENRAGVAKSEGGIGVALGIDFEPFTDLDPNSYIYRANHNFHCRITSTPVRWPVSLWQESSEAGTTGPRLHRISHWRSLLRRGLWPARRLLEETVHRS